MKITRKQMRQLIRESLKTSLQGFHYAIKPYGMRDKVIDDPSVHSKIKTLLDDPENTAQAFELTAAMDPTGEYGRELDQHDHAFLSSPEYEEMFEDDMYKSSEAYRSAPFKALIHKLLDDSGLRSGLDNLVIETSMNERKNTPQAMIVSTNKDQLRRFKEYLDNEGGMKVRTWPEDIGPHHSYPGSNMPSASVFSFFVLPA